MQGLRHLHGRGLPSFCPQLHKTPLRLGQLGLQKPVLRPLGRGIDGPQV